MSDPDPPPENAPKNAADELEADQGIEVTEDIDELEAEGEVAPTTPSADPVTPTAPPAERSQSAPETAPIAPETATSAPAVLPSAPATGPPSPVPAPVPVGDVLQDTLSGLRDSIQAMAQGFVSMRGELENLTADIHHERDHQQVAAVAALAARPLSPRAPITAAVTPVGSPSRSLQPVVDLDLLDHGMVADEDAEVMPRPTVPVEPVVPVSSPSSARTTIRSRQLQPTPQPSIPQTAAHAVIDTELQDMIESIRSSQNGISIVSKEVVLLRNKIDELTIDIEHDREWSHKLGNFVNDLNDGKADRKTQKNFTKTLDRISGKIIDIVEEAGIGEAINISKIPPQILEVVYQATLDDLTTQLDRTMGPHETELVLISCLENVRLSTSGSEMFYYDSAGHIRLRKLAESMLKGRVSARQIQTTYDEILNKLLIHLPNYKPKNFRAMIKVKSQEYAVESATLLILHTTRIDGNLERLNQMLAALQAQMNSKVLQLERRIEAEKEELEERQGGRLTSVEGGLEEFSQQNAKRWAELESRLDRVESELRQRLDRLAMAGELLPADEEEDAPAEEVIPEESVEEPAAPDPEPDQVSETPTEAVAAVESALDRAGFGFGSITLGDDDDVTEILASPLHPPPPAPIPGFGEADGPDLPADIPIDPVEEPAGLYLDDLKDQESWVYRALEAEPKKVTEVKKYLKTLMSAKAVEKALESLDSHGVIERSHLGRARSVCISVVLELRPSTVLPPSAEPVMEEELEELLEADDVSETLDEKIDDTYVLDKVQASVLAELPTDGATLQDLRRRIGARIPYTEVLRALKKLLDHEVIVSSTKDRRSMYTRTQREVRKDA